MTTVAWDEAAVLRDRGLWPAEMGGRFEDPAVPFDITDRYRGAMLGTAIGEAIANPGRGSTPAAIGERFGTLNRFVTRPYPEWLLPAGQIGDDSQLAILVASSITTVGNADPVDLTHRLSAWLPVARTPGPATKAAVQALRNGAPWVQSGRPTDSKGALVRAVPVGLANPLELDTLRIETVVSTVVTHTDPSAVAAAVATAAAVAHLTRTPPGGFRAPLLQEAIHRAIEGLSDPQRPLPNGGAAPLAERVDHAFGLLGRNQTDALSSLGTGDQAIQVLPAALWCFANNADDLVGAVVSAAHAGGASDTIAALTGAFAGAYHGAAALPPVWVDHLEYADGLAGLGDALCTLSGSGTPAERSPMRHPLSPASYRPFRLGGVDVPTLEHAIRASQVADPATSVKVRLLPTPADARRFAATVPARQDWDTNATGTVSAVIGRRFADGHPDSRFLRSCGDDVLESMAGAFAPGDPFDYPVLLAIRRGELAFDG